MKTTRRASRHWDIGKLLRTGLLIFAVALQGYIAQVHHHDPVSTAAADLAVAVASGGTTGVPSHPIDSDGHDLHCFICHLSGHGSVSVLPPPILLALGSTDGLAYRVGHDSVASHDSPSAYSSRGPPFLFVSA